MPTPTRKELENLGFTLVETREPYTLLNNTVLFLSEIPRTTDFEKGMVNATYLEDNKEKSDNMEDDTALVIHVKGKGLVIVTGCAHAGIINTVYHAIETTGIKKVHAIMGGFHLNGPAFEPAIEKTIAALLQITPDYVIPAHCTGRNAIMAIERAMPGQFILNMSGTTLTFTT